MVLPEGELGASFMVWQVGVPLILLLPLSLTPFVIGRAGSCTVLAVFVAIAADYPWGEYERFRGAPPQHNCAMPRSRVMANPLALALTCAVAHAAGPSLAEPVGEPEADAARVLHAWAKAQVERDMAVIDSIEADDFTFTSNAGEVFNKQQDIADLQSGAWRTTSLELVDVHAHAYGDAVIMTSRAIRQGRYKDRDAGGQFQWTDVFVRRGGRWRLVAHQGSRIAAPAVGPKIDAAPLSTEGPGTADRGGAQISERNVIRPEKARREHPFSKAELAILKLEEERRQAVLRGDTGALDRLLAGNFVSTTTRGEVRDKRLTMALYKTGEIKQLFNSVGDVQLRLYGDSAIVTGRTTWKELFGNEERGGQFRFTRVWVRHPGRWQLAAMHGTLIKEVD